MKENCDIVPMLLFFRSHIVILILLVLSLLVSITTVIDYWDYLDKREASSLAIGQQVSTKISEDINVMLTKITDKAANLADSIGSNDIRNEALLELIERESRSMDQILGITVAFEPFRYAPSVRLYAPYFDKHKDNFIFIEDVYDYTDATLQTSQWYVNVRNGGAAWIEPYYAEGAQATVADYGVPFYRTNPDTGRREVAGTITMTISLDDFTRLLNSLSLGKTGYGFILSPEGNYIAHPISEYISRKSVQEVARERRDEVLAQAGKRMVAGRTGHVQFRNNLSDQVSYLFHSHIPNAGWSLGVVFIKNELLGTPVELRKKLMHIGFSVSFSVLFGMMLVMGIYRWEENRLWSGMVLLSLIIVANIGYIWYLTLHYTFPNESDERFKIVNTTMLNRFINLENRRARELRVDPPVVIPTGIYIHEVEFEDSYNVNVSATIWQKYQTEETKGIRRAVTFPQTSPFAEALLVEQSISPKPGYELVTWEVRATYRLDFDYSTYPFDYRHFDLLISHPDRDRNILLTPFLDSYKIINQSTRPGINPDMVLPQSKVDASFFDYTLRSFNTNFGVDKFGGEKVPQLHFNVILKRHFINAFVSNIIPIFIIALMVYFVVYSSSKQSKVGGISSLGVVESSAAFFFVLLLAHIDLRKSVTTPVITYMESFYFIMYIILALVAFNIVMFTRRDHYLFFDYKDNLIVKLAYWPFFLSMCLIITLQRFY